MIVGVPREMKDNEARVGVTPAGVKTLAEAGHTVLVEAGAGAQSGFPDAEYRNAGAEIVPEAAQVWKRAEMVVKVKEPIEAEYSFLREGLVLFTYLHLAPLPVLTCRTAGIEGDRHCLRNGARPARHAAAFDAYERGGRAHERAGGRQLSRKRARRARHSAGRRSGRASGARGDSGRRHCGHQRGPHRPGLWRQGHPHRHRPEPPARARRPLRRTSEYAGLEQLQHRPCRRARPTW